MSETSLTGVERTFRDDEIIVSKTDLKGRMTYCNDVFLRLASYSEAELIGQPHSLIRHPHMPRCVFKLLWDTIAEGKEIFAYVVNRSRNGDHYWVFAHVTPDLDEQGAIVGYHSNRRTAESKARAVIEPLYAALLAEEGRHGDRKAGLTASTQMLLNVLGEKGVSYDQFVLSL
jgi:PAS domain S-box-containing protein